MTEEEKLQKEIDKVSDILDLFGYEAHVEDMKIGDGKCIRLRDAMYESDWHADEELYSAKEILLELADDCREWFLDGHVCCDINRRFKTYEEAERESYEKDGEYGSAPMIHQVREIMGDDIALIE